MKIKVWIAIDDMGDGSKTARLFPSLEMMKEKMGLDEDLFQEGWDIPVEVDSRIIEVDDFQRVD